MVYHTLFNYQLFKYFCFIIKQMMMAGVILLAASCSSENEMSVNDAQVENTEVLAPVTVRVSDFSMSVEDIGGEVTRSGGLGTTRAAQSAAAYDKVTFLTLAFYASDGTLAYRDDQVRSDASTYDTFGEFEFELPIGSYTMEVFGYGGDNLLTLTSYKGYDPELTTDVLLLVVV